MLQGEVVEQLNFTYGQIVDAIAVEASIDINGREHHPDGDECLVPNVS